MGLGDSTRVNSNLQSLNALRALHSTNEKLGVRQMRLATGSRINRAEDDSAGYSIAKKLEAKVRGQAQALANVGDAKGMLSVAEGGLNTVMDILHTMKEKAIQAANDSMGTDERTLIKNQLNALSDEAAKVLTDASYNGKTMFGTSAVTLSFHVGAGTSDVFTVTLASLSVGGLGVSNGSLTVSAATSAAASIGRIDGAITKVANRLGSLGDSQSRLSFKEKNLQVSMNNYEASRSRIADADFAKEQMNIVKLQILQQTGTAALAQANSAPQSVLSLF